MHLGYWVKNRAIVRVVHRLNQQCAVGRRASFTDGPVSSYYLYLWCSWTCAIHSSQKRLDEHPKNTSPIRAGVEIPQVNKAEIQILFQMSFHLRSRSMLPHSAFSSHHRSPNLQVMHQTYRCFISLRSYRFSHKSQRGWPSALGDWAIHFCKATAQCCKHPHAREGIRWLGKESITWRTLCLQWQVLPGKAIQYKH